MSTAAANSAKQPQEEAGEPDSKRPKLAADDSTRAASQQEPNNGASAGDPATASLNKVNKGNNGGQPASKAGNKSFNGTDQATTGFEGDVEGEDNSASEGVFDARATKCLEEVENIQSEICSLNEKASEEILKVEQKFNKLRRPHFEKRNELLKEIPNFWLTALANHSIIAPMMTSTEDEDCLHYMINLDVEEFEDIKSGYRLKLHFIENPYINNEVIVKEFNISSSDDVSSSSTPIEYKNTPQGKSLKQVVENSVAQYRRSRRPGQQSFFAWLSEPTESGPDAIAEILKDQIWPNPLEFFFSTSDDYGVDDESEDEDEEIDDEIDDDSDDDDDHVITEGGVEFSDEEVDGPTTSDEDDDEEDI